jgi:peptidyl-prolyl cis-trans isomerase C
MSSPLFDLRVRPIAMVEAPKPAAEVGDDHAREGREAARTLGQPAPCYLFVGETGITEADIAQEMQHHRTSRPEQSRADAARALVVRELLRREVERLGLAAQVLPNGRESAEEGSIRVLLEREVEQRVPSDDDCRRYYEQNRERFRSPDRIRVRHILLGAPADDVNGRCNARSEGERLISELKADPELFADFAMRFSRCLSKEHGGDLGWLQRGQTTPEFDRQVFRLGEGLAPFPVESRWGYHVVTIDEIQPGEALGFDAVRAQISDYLELQVRQRELQHYLRGLQQRYAVRGLEEIEAQVA